MDTTQVMQEERDYDELRQLTKIATSPGREFHYGYNAVGLRDECVATGEFRWDWGYDSKDQLIDAEQSTLAEDPLPGRDFAFTFDDIGNRETATTNGRQATWTANLVNQLTQRAVPGYLDITGVADAAATVVVNGDPVTREGTFFHRALSVDNATDAVWQDVRVVAGVPGTGGGADQASVTEGNLFLPETPEAFTFDLDGNMTQDGRFTYTWNGENRLINVETRSGLPAGVPRQKIEFTYDSQGRRRTKKVSDWNGSAYALTREHEFFWDNWNLIEERITEGAATTVNRFVWGLDLSGSLQGAGGVGGLVMMELDGVVYFPVFDGNGNVTALVDTAGNVDGEYDYGPFGETLRMSGPAAAANPFRFSTKYFDSETGLYYYGYRYYSPELGRWLSRDPMGEAGGLNVYAAFGNIPTSSFDYFGLQSSSHNKKKPSLLKRIFLPWLVSAEKAARDDARELKRESGIELALNGFKVLHCLMGCHIARAVNERSALVQSFADDEDFLRYSWQYEMKTKEDELSTNETLLKRSPFVYELSFMITEDGRHWIEKMGIDPMDLSGGLDRLSEDQKDLLVRLRYEMDTATDMAATAYGWECGRHHEGSCKCLCGKAVSWGMDTSQIMSSIEGDPLLTLSTDELDRIREAAEVATDYFHGLHNLPDPSQIVYR